MNNSMEVSVIQSTTKDLSSLTDVVLEVTIDQIMNDGILKDIPVINSIRCVTKGITSIRDALFTKKILEFLYHAKEIPVNARTKFLEKHSDIKSNLGERLIYILDSIDNQKKTKIIANLYKATVMEDIDIELFFRLCIAVQNCLVSELEYLKAAHYNEITGIQALVLYNNGLLSTSRIDGGSASESGNIYYRINELGENIINYGL